MRPNWKPAVVGGMSTLFALVLAECGLQWNARVERSQPSRVVNFEFFYTAIHNHDGFRGPELPREKTNGKQRVVMLGDSFMYGSGTADPDTIPALLQDTLFPGVVWPRARFLQPSKYQVSVAYFAAARKLGFTFTEETPVGRTLQDAILQWATTEKIETVDALPVLIEAERATGTRHYHLLDDHYKAEGNRLLARLPADRLRLPTLTEMH